MLKSYVGIAGPKGLQILCLEDDKTAQGFARLVASDRGSRNICLWAVLSDDDAREACRQIRRGETVAALTTLDRLAECVGRVLPPEAH